MSEEVKQDKKGTEDQVGKSIENNNATDDKTMSIYTRLWARISLLNIGLVVFIIAFHKATQISVFDTSKLLLFEICLLILFIFIIGISTVLATIRYKCTTERVVALLIYVSALLGMVLVLLLWTFFKASPV